jgi:hypothetical protein
MKTFLKILGALVVTLVAGVAIFWFGWLTPPDAGAVCDNVERITKAELDKKTKELGDATEATKRTSRVSEKGLAEVRKDCERIATREPEFGKAVWVKRLKCMRDAGDIAALKDCDQIRSL